MTGGLIFSFGLWLWCHPSHCVKSFPGSTWQQTVSWQKEAERERVDSSRLKSDMENVILLSQRMKLISWYLPTEADINMRTLWGSMLSKQQPGFIAFPSTCYEIVCYPNWTTDNDMVKSWHGGQSQQSPKQRRGHAGHELRPGHS